MSSKKFIPPQNDVPTIGPNESLPELTLKALILGVVLTIVLAAANAYLGLKVGQTISASIPAAIISMSVLRFFKNSNILENNMVQTMASVGEGLTSGVSFILPSLIILHTWNGFYYWQTVIIALLGGTLGVLFTIPLRRALLMDKTLRFPEGVAISNVLKASALKEKTSMRSLTVGGIVGAFITFLQAGFQIISDSFQYWVTTTNSIVGFGLGLSPALIAAGYIVGINVAIGTLVGILIGWIGGVPILSYIYGVPAAATAADGATQIWLQYIRYLGVGTMLVGGLWTLVTLVKPITQSLHASIQTLRKAKVSKEAVNIPRTEHDIPINYVFWAILLLIVPIFLFLLIAIIPEAAPITHSFKVVLAAFSTLYIIVGGFIFCSISSYFAGLIGSTNNPVSGLLVSSLLILCLAILFLFSFAGGISGKETLGMILGIGSTVIIASGLSISNDTMQDLKVGQLIGATPWKQQVMLVLGVVVAAFVIPPILDLLYQAYGIGGVFPRPGMNPNQMLAAPQAGLMATVAKGVYTYHLEWTMIITGAIIAVICIIIDEYLKTRGSRLPVLAVGVGIYLPLSSSVPVVIGGILSFIIQLRLNSKYDKRKAGTPALVAQHKHRGLLLSCGIVAGASLMGVCLAIPFALEQSSDALRIMPAEFAGYAGVFGLVVTFFLCAWIYKVVMGKD